MFALGFYFGHMLTDLASSLQTVSRAGSARNQAPPAEKAEVGEETAEGAVGKPEVQFRVPTSGLLTFDFQMETPPVAPMALRDTMKGRKPKPSSKAVDLSPEQSTPSHFSKKPGFKRSFGSRSCSSGHVSGNGDDASEGSAGGGTGIVPLPRRLEQVPARLLLTFACRV